MSAYGRRSYASASLTGRFPFRGKHHSEDYSKGGAVRTTLGNQSREPEVRASARTSPSVGGMRLVFAPDICHGACLITLHRSPCSAPPRRILARLLRLRSLS